MYYTSILDCPEHVKNTATKFSPISRQNTPKREVSYYHRDYTTDLSFINPAIIKRVVVSSLPFISLYKPAGCIISFSLDSFRSITDITSIVNDVKNKQLTNASIHALSTAFSVCSLIATIFYYPVGILIITSQDTLINSSHLVNSIKANNRQEIIENTIKLANNAIYGLSIFFGFSLEIQISSLSIQVIYQLFYSIVEGKKGNYIELIEHFGMLAIRGNQLYSQTALLKRKWEIEKQIKNVFVGKLHEKWQFPSDHLPIGAEVDGVEIVSWNVLNNKYINWVYEDSQGLKGSMITDLDVAIQDDGLTKRDTLVVSMINQMIQQSEKRGVIALQECSSPFLSKLEQVLPSNWEIVKSHSESRSDQNVILYDRERLSYNSTNSMISLDGYPSQKERPIMNISFERKGKLPLRIFNTHIPGDPNLPGRDEFAKYIRSHSNLETEIPIALGDMNFEREEMIRAMQKAHLNEHLIHSPYHTNVDPYSKESKCIDHMIIFGENVESTKIENESIGIDLQPTLNVLNRF